MFRGFFVQTLHFSTLHFKRKGTKRYCKRKVILLLSEIKSNKHFVQKKKNAKKKKEGALCLRDVLKIALH